MMTTVSVIVPCYNEESTIRNLLEAIYTQTYPKSELEVIIADGLSTDNTKAVINAYKVSHPDLNIKVIDNTRRAIPSGLNRAIEASSSSYIVRMDAHSIPNRDYIQKCIEGLDKGLGDNVGGIWEIQPGAPTCLAKTIAIAASHPLGAGDARYRIGGKPQEVETVPFGSFHRDLIKKIGMFDETLLTNEDYEFNTRIRQLGGKVWLDPSISSIYYARPTIRELAKQYLRYGYWKAQMVKRYPKTLRWRQLVPPLFVLSLFTLLFLSIGWILARWLLAVIVIVYTIIVFAIGIQMSIKHKNLSISIGFLIAIFTIHLSWGSAFLWGMLMKPVTQGPQA
jgi:glycosyltransferase involved in cell wall biosynthesis